MISLEKRIVACLLLCVLITGSIASATAEISSSVAPAISVATSTGQVVAANATNTSAGETEPIPQINILIKAEYAVGEPVAITAVNNGQMPAWYETGCGQPVQIYKFENNNWKTVQFPIGCVAPEYRVQNKIEPGENTVVYMWDQKDGAEQVTPGSYKVVFPYYYYGPAPTCGGGASPTASTGESDSSPTCGGYAPERIYSEATSYFSIVGDEPRPREISVYTDKDRYYPFDTARVMVSSLRRLSGLNGQVISPTGLRQSPTFIEEVIAPLCRNEDGTSCAAIYLYTASVQLGFAEQGKYFVEVSAYDESAAFARARTFFNVGTEQPCASGGACPGNNATLTETTQQIIYETITEGTVGYTTVVVPTTSSIGAAYPINMTAQAQQAYAAVEEFKDTIQTRVTAIVGGALTKETAGLLQAILDEVSG